MKLRLGDRELNSNIILAPMAGVTDLLSGFCAMSREREWR